VDSYGGGELLNHVMKGTCGCEMFLVFWRVSHSAGNFWLMSGHLGAAVVFEQIEEVLTKQALDMIGVI
jgi:hypothetical protein